MKVKKLTISNVDGDSITFGRHFFLDDEKLDLSGLQADVSYVESNANGAHYQRTRMSTRSLSIAFFIKGNGDESLLEEKKREIFTVCNPLKNPMSFYIVASDDEEYTLTGELVSTPTFSTEYEKSNEFFQDGLLQLTCSDPFLYRKNATIVQIGEWIPNLTFPIVIPEDTGIAFAIRNPTLIVNVFNSGQLDSGVTIKFIARSTVKKPSLINVNTREQLKLNVEMQTGDVIEVSTHTNRLYAKLNRNNVITSVFNYIDLYSDFLQVRPGDNLFRYDAEDGIEYLEVTIEFTEKLVGA